MALPVSPGEIYAVAKFAYDLWQNCKASEKEFEQIGKEVFAMRTVVELVHIECQDPESIINLVDNKERTVRKQLRVYIGNCEQALKSVDRLLKRYEAMTWGARIAWSLSGHAEISSLESNLSSFATQLDSYVQKLEVKGIALVNKNVGIGFDRIALRIGRLEDLLEHHNGNVKAAVAQMMQERQQCSGSQKDQRRSQTVMLDYVKEMCSDSEKKQRPKTPDPPRGRHHGSTLGIPKDDKRATSADTASHGTRKAKSLSPKPKKSKKAEHTLECWLIQRKSAQALFITFELSEKESQCRGQWKLREMAKQFNGSCQNDKLESKDDLVTWVLKDRRKKEEDPKFTWYPHAAKIERKSEFLLGMGVEEQAMVIIRRQMTPSAQKVADEKAAEKAKKDAKKREAEKKAAKQRQAEAAFKKEKKEQAAKIKALEKENAKLKMPKDENTNGTAPKSEHSPAPKDKADKDTATAEPKKPKRKSTRGKAKAKEAEHGTTKEAEKTKPDPKKEAAFSKDGKPGTSDLDATTDAPGKATAEKAKKKENRLGVTSKEPVDGTKSKDEKERKASEVQWLKDENAKLRAALKDAGSEI